ncbi:MAG: SRPBCC family protein [Actinomycetota bacterium]
METADISKEIDLLERCRAGDRRAFRALATFWAEPALRLAFLLCADQARAEAALRTSLLSVWRDLPKLHSESPFRPWLMGMVTRESVSAEGPFAHPALATMDASLRTEVVLNAFLGIPAHEVALAVDRPRAATTLRLRRALREIETAGPPLREALAEAAWDVDLSQTFLDDHVLGWLERAPNHVVRRLIAADPHTAWAVLCDPTALPGWIEATHLRAPVTGALRPGSRVRARGRIAGARASRDETVITRTEPEALIAWTTRARPAGLFGAIEFRWSIEIARAQGGTEISHRLDGVAFPPGVAGNLLRRAWKRAEPSMPTAMHRGIERCAALIETRSVP